MIHEIIDHQNAELLEDQINCYMFGNVKFLKNFGPWVTDVIYNCIEFDFFSGEVTEYGETGEIIHKVKIGITLI